VNFIDSTTFFEFLFGTEVRGICWHIGSLRWTLSRGSYYSQVVSLNIFINFTKFFAFLLGTDVRKRCLHFENFVDSRPLESIELLEASISRNQGANMFIVPQFQKETRKTSWNL